MPPVQAMTVLAGRPCENFGAEGDLHAEQHVNAGGDHGGGVDQRGDRGGAFHGVRQPDVERELGGLADGAAEDAEHGGGDHAVAADGEIGGDVGVDAGFHRIEGEGAGDAPEHEDADHESEVADAVAEEGLLGGIRGGVLLIPVADEQIGTETDQFPEDEGHDEVVGQHDAGHREHEKRKTGEVAGLRLVVLHVGEREDVDQRADAGDDDHHAGGELVELDADLEVEVADGRPVEGSGSGSLPSRRKEMTSVATAEAVETSGTSGVLAQHELVHRGDDEREEEEDPGEVHGSRREDLKYQRFEI